MANTSQFADDPMRGHVISLGNDGHLESDPAKTRYATTPDDVEAILAEYREVTSSWAHPRLALLAHGGLVGEQQAVDNLREHVVPSLLSAHIYPLALVWHTDVPTTLFNLADDAAGTVPLSSAAELRAQAEHAKAPASAEPSPSPAEPGEVATPSRSLSESLFDLAADISDDLREHHTGIAKFKDETVESVAHLGAFLWDKMKQNAETSTVDDDGGARFLIDRIVANKLGGHVHLVGHSAGSILLAYLVAHCVDQRLKLRSCTLWAPACSIDLARGTYLRAFETGKIGYFQLQTLTPEAEIEDNCKGIYGHSLLYLVSNSFEHWSHRDRDYAKPLLGLTVCVERDQAFMAMFAKPHASWVQQPFFPTGDTSAHGLFSGSPIVFNETIDWIRKADS